MKLAHIQPGKPAQNAFVERFNGSIRNEFLNQYLFDSLNQVRSMADYWIEQYNYERPHEGLKNLTPMEYRTKEAHTCVPL